MDRSGVFLQPEQLHGPESPHEQGREWKMPQPGRIVGIDVSKRQAEACLRSPPARLAQPSTPEGRQRMIAWLRERDVALAVMEASGGYEREWAEALRQAGVAVRIVDPKRVRYFARSAGRLAKNDPIDAAMIAWFAETFTAEAAPAEDPERAAVDRLMTARAMLVRLESQIKQLGEHRQPPLVERAQRAIAKAILAQRTKLEAAIAAKIERHAGFAARAGILRSVPGLGPRFTAGAIAWLPELGTIANRAAARMNASQPSERPGSRPQPSQAGARSASLEPGRSPGYLSTTQLLTPPSPPMGERGSFAAPHRH